MLQEVEVLLDLLAKSLETELEIWPSDDDKYHIVENRETGRVFLTNREFTPAELVAALHLATTVMDYIEVIPF